MLAIRVESRVLLINHIVDNTDKIVITTISSIKVKAL
jgi:hypothetical protein